MLQIFIFFPNRVLSYYERVWIWEIHIWDFVLNFRFIVNVYFNNLSRYTTHYNYSYKITQRNIIIYTIITHNILKGSNTKDREVQVYQHVFATYSYCSGLDLGEIVVRAQAPNLNLPRHQLLGWKEASFYFYNGDKNFLFIWLRSSSQGLCFRIYAFFV